MEMDRAHSLQTNIKGHKTGPLLNPHGKRKRGRPRNTWRRDHKVDIRKTGHSRSQLERMAQNRDLWQTVVDGLCPRRSDGLRQIDR